MRLNRQLITGIGAAYTSIREDSQKEPDNNNGMRDYSDYTDAQLNVAIAQACGIIKSPNSWTGVVAATGESVQIPDYCNDIDAINEAAKTVLQNQFNTLYEAYWRNLAHVKPHPSFATARQRAEAFLRTLGKKVR